MLEYQYDQYNQNNHKMNNLRVATLNFSGINISPFEYHDGSEQKAALDLIFKEMFDEERSKSPNDIWNIGKLDKLFNKERYSILYRSDCGFVRGRLLTRDQYDVVWDLTFDMNQGIVGHMSLEDDLINKLRTFDWLVYKAFVSFVFGSFNSNTISQYSVTKYKDELKKWHSKSYLNEDKKIDYVKQYILAKNLDIMFIQQAVNSRSSDYLPNKQYSLIKNMDSLIVYKKDSYIFQDKSDLESFDAKYKSKINFNKDSVYLKSQNLLLMSVHLSSKSVNVQQAKQMFETLTEIENDYKNISIIIGIDANHYITTQGNMKTYPDLMVPTTRKKRTHMQCQLEKGGKLVEETKDYIITNRSIKQWEVNTIKLDQINDSLLPTERHPYDHFLISAKIQFNKAIFRRMQSNISSALQIRIGSTDSQSDIRRHSIIEEIGRVVPPQKLEFARRRTLTSFKNQYEPLQIPKYLSTIDKDEEQTIESRDRRMTRI